MSAVIGGQPSPPLFGSINDPSISLTAGVTGIAPESFGDGVQGRTRASDGHGVLGQNLSNSALGFLGGSDPVFHQRAGVYGESDMQGVMGLSTSDTGTGVYGGNNFKDGHGFGVRGDTSNGVGVQGESFSEGAGIQGISHSGNQGLAGRFIGNVHVQGNPGTSSGDLRVEGTSSFGGTVTCDGNIKAFDVELSGGDCAEDFEIAGLEVVDPGTVMVIDKAGALRPCERAYDRRVTGVLSGAGDYKPGIVLDKRPSTAIRLPLALVGKVYCKVDAAFGPIEVGDLLTTSATEGHAMKANDPLQAFGSVIGKALRPLNAGQGMIPILIALQ